MEFKIRSRTNPNIVNYPTQDYKKAESFANHIKSEFGDFLKAVVLFGSSAKKNQSDKSDIDVLVVIDDLSLRLSDEVVEAYKIIVEKTIAKISTKLHVTSMTLSSFWEYARNGDPVAINIFRDGVPLVDFGFFTPMQALLRQGRIRPTHESMWAYFGRAPKTLTNSRWHILQATLDLYWAVIDSAHAALMKIGEIPPAPDHVAEMLDKKLVKRKLLEKKYVDTMHKFYTLMKNITHRDIKQIKGSEYENLYYEADRFVNRMRDIIES